MATSLVRRSFLPVGNKTFVDREGPLRIFERAIFSVPPDRSSVCVFYGVGGQGKTALRRKLWDQTDSTADPSYAFLHRAEIDLHGKVLADADMLLVWIRNGFASSGISFPSFDLALAATWEETRPE